MNKINQPNLAGNGASSSRAPDAVQIALGSLRNGVAALEALAAHPAAHSTVRAAQAQRLAPRDDDPVGTVSDLFPTGLLMPYSGGVFGLSATYESSDYDNGGLLVRLPDGWVRSHVVVQKHDPKDGGWCAFLQWDSPDDPTAAEFKVHVGCPAFQGGTVECHVYVVKTD